MAPLDPHPLSQRTRDRLRSENARQRFNVDYALAVEQFKAGDYTTSVRFLEDAFNKGNGTKEASFYLGQAYRDGLGVEVDLEKAYNMSYIASRHGNGPIEAIWAVAQALEFGLGRPPHLELAAINYSILADKNHVPALFKMGQIYENGLNETNYKPNLLRAAAFYARAAEKGHPEALEQLKALVAKL